MKIIVFMAIIGIASADKLAHSYFAAPSSARTAGGSGHYLATPSLHGQQQQQRFGGGNSFKTLRNDYHSDGVGNYNYAYETENGIAHNEEGHVQYEADKIVKGSYSYIGDDGKLYTVNYYADANGFHAMGDHLPGNNAGYSGGGLPGGFGAAAGNNKPYSNYRVKPASHSPSSNTKFTGYPYTKPSTAYLPVFSN